MDLSILSRPLKIGNRIAPNRFVNQPMEGNDADPSGNPSDLTFNRYCRLAEGSAGIIMVESLSVSTQSKARKNQLSIQNQNADHLAKLVKEIKKINPDVLVIFQIDHSGIFGGSFSDVVSYYPAYTPKVDLNFRIISDNDIEKIQKQFVESAIIANQAGADGIDFKHCHGYLCSQLLRPANTKQGRYGGSFENRTRFFRETASEMKTAIKDENFIFGMRISIYEDILGGIGTTGPNDIVEDLTEPLAFCRMVEEAGFHFINVSAGSPMMTAEMMRPTSKCPIGVYRQFGWARSVKNVVGLPVIGSAYSHLGNGENKLPGSNQGEKSLLYWAAKNIQDGNVDMVGIGRQSLADPFFVKKALNGEIEKINFCKTCGCCSKLIVSGTHSGCVVYNKFYKEEFRKTRKKDKIQEIIPDTLGV